jgi:hypothetical protein
MKEDCSAAEAARSAGALQSLLATAILKGSGADVGARGRVSRDRTGKAGECQRARAWLPCRGTSESARSSAPPLLSRHGAEGERPQAAGAGAAGR